MEVLKKELPEGENTSDDIEKLETEILTLEKETLLNYSAKCSTSVKSEDKKLRDLLMIAIFVLENLICDEKRYPEAQEILDSM